MSLRTFNEIILVLICIVLSVALFGCSGLIRSPGQETATAMREQMTTIWGPDGSFRSDIDGGKDPNVVMFDGDGLMFVVDDDGKTILDESGNPTIDFDRSKIHSYLRIQTDSAALGDAFAKAAQEGTKQLKMFAEQFGNMMEIMQTMLPIMAASSGPPQSIGPDPPLSSVVVSPDNE